MSDNADKLIRMANQIATFFKGQGEDGAAAQVAEHLKAFWTPRMREDLGRICEGEVKGLDPVVRAAAGLLDRKDG
jgi:formate dehydrogenase subunit delta